jgi:N6-adenosine-specific RNA methylase IME4
MTLADIMALPVGEWAAKDCVLRLWATDPLLEKAFEVIQASGSTYKTVGFYWAKLKGRNGIFLQRTKFLHHSRILASRSK